MRDARPVLVLAGGSALAFLAAAVNVGFMVRLGTSVSHLTGDLSRFALDTVDIDRDSASALWQLAAALVGFVLGATLSGYFIHHPTLELTRPYGRSITAIGGLLLLSHPLMRLQPHLSLLLAAAACGYQNALATYYRGVILRTTHVTGLLTDLGVSMGMRLRHGEVERWKVVAPLWLCASFFAGALAGAALTLAVGEASVAILGGCYVLGGVAWSVLKRRGPLRV